jgi:hypothetical protein
MAALRISMRLMSYSDERDARSLARDWSPGHRTALISLSAQASFWLKSSRIDAWRGVTTNSRLALPSVVDSITVPWLYNQRSCFDPPI